MKWVEMTVGCLEIAMNWLRRHSAMDLFLMAVAGAAFAALQVYYFLSWSSPFEFTLKRLVLAPFIGW